MSLVDDSPTLAESIGKRIRELRNEKKTTPEELAHDAGVAAITIRQYEKGKRLPTIDKLIRLSLALNVNISRLILPLDVPPDHPDPERFKKTMKEWDAELMRRDSAKLAEAKMRIIDNIQQLSEENIVTLSWFIESLGADKFFWYTDAGFTANKMNVSPNDLSEFIKVVAKSRKNEED